MDFSRVRLWALNGWNKFYRQTLLFSSLPTPEMNSLFNGHCSNILCVASTVYHCSAVADAAFLDTNTLCWEGEGY